MKYHIKRSTLNYKINEYQWKAMEKWTWNKISKDYSRNRIKELRGIK